MHHRKCKSVTGFPHRQCIGDVTAGIFRLRHRRDPYLPQCAIGCGQLQSRFVAEVQRFEPDTALRKNNRLHKRHSQSFWCEEAWLARQRRANCRPTPPPNPTRRIEPMLAAP